VEDVVIAVAVVLIGVVGQLVAQLPSIWAVETNDRRVALLRLDEADIGLSRKALVLGEVLVADRQRKGLAVSRPAPADLAQVSLCDLVETKAELLGQVGDVPEHVAQLFGHLSAK
jgi:hypothetical protein